MSTSFIKKVTSTNIYANTPGQGIDTPAFSIELSDYTDELQQKNNDNNLEDYDNETYNLKVNDIIFFKYKNKTKKGIIRKILKNENGNVYKITVDTNEDNNTFDINPTQIIKTKKPNINASNDDVISTPSMSESESTKLTYINSFNEYIKKRR